MKIIRKFICFITAMCFLIGCSNEKVETNYIESYERPSLLNGVDVTYDEEFTPNLESYSINSDFSNVLNTWDISGLSAEAKEKLLTNNFVLVENESRYGTTEFSYVYSNNDSPYVKTPSFVTTDSALHAFHLYYEYFQRITEKNYLIDRIFEMSSELLENSKNQLNSLKGTDWESAAQRNVDYFSVAVALCGGDNYESTEEVIRELELINEAETTSLSPIFTTEERNYQQDYTQFIVRGYYTDDENLSKYFKVMMWYGQMTFTQTSNELNKSALLMNLALTGKALEDYECVYEVTSFFAGESDDNTYYEYYPIIEYFYGDDLSLENLPEMAEEYEGYLSYISELPKPEINSMIVNRGIEPEEEVTNGFRLLGQRASLDSWIMENLTYEEVKESKNKETRNLPNVLDVPAALGSDLALDIVSEEDNTDKWPTYATQMEEIREEISNKGNNLYSMSISSAWLGSLTSILSEKGEGWPSYTQSESWNKKNLNTFLGSYTELKHDLVLYTKRKDVGACAVGEEVDHDDRGYVETEPVLFHRLSSIIEATINGLESYQMIGDDDIESLQEIKNYFDIFESIAVKEINGELPTDEEFDAIRSYGGLLYSAWYKNAREKAGTDWFDPVDYPSYLVTDIATGYDTVLEIANGVPMDIYVAVYFDGQIRIAKGVVYNNYSFEVSSKNRLTDNQWQEIVKSNDHTIIPPISEWKLDICDDLYSSKSEYQGIENNLDNYKTNEIVINADSIKVRDFPSIEYGEHTGKVQKGEKYIIYDKIENDGYTWYRISEQIESDMSGSASWIASKDDWVTEQIENSKKLDCNSENEHLLSNDSIFKSFNKKIEILEDGVEVTVFQYDSQSAIDYLPKGSVYYALYQCESENYIYYNIGSYKWARAPKGSTAIAEK